MKIGKIKSIETVIHNIHRLLSGSNRQTWGPALSGQVPKIISLYYPVSKIFF